jgi:hypothetical protein
MTDREANALKIIQHKIDQFVLILEAANRQMIAAMSEKTGHMPEILVYEIKKANDYILYGEEVVKWFNDGKTKEEVLAMINQFFIDYHMGWSNKPKECCEVMAAIACAIK